MDISRFKDIVRKVTTFKDYSPLLVPAVLVVVAVLLFIPTRLMSSKLKKQMNSQSISNYTQLKRLIETTPSNGQWEEEQRYQLAYRRDANEIALLAQRSTQRQLLIYNIFPKAKDQSALVFREFGRQFQTGIDRLLGRVRARDCPTNDELEKYLKVSSGPRPSGAWGATATPGSLESTIKDALCVEKAKSASVYANPADLSGYEYWGEYKYVGPTIDDAIKECWYWQLGYWVIEDVIDTINILNSGSDSVFTSPVKRLMSVNFGSSSAGGRVVSYRERAAGSGLPSDSRPPTYVLSSGVGQLTEPCTGRVCNEDIDVVHFNIRVVVSAKAVLPFMQQLCSAKQHEFNGWSGSEQERVFKHNQITILRSRIEPIDRQEQNHNLYRYGEDGVVEMNLVCEYIFNKNGYDEIKPDSVKESLGQEQEQPPAATPTTQGTETQERRRPGIGF